MPCHCDGRKLCGDDEGLHRELEGHWAGIVGPAFDDAALTGPKAPATEELIKAAKAVDARAGVRFPDKVPPMPYERDAWLEVVDMARASFAVMGIIVPEALCRYDDEATRVKFGQAFDPNDPKKQKLLKDVTRVALHDAVVNTAMIWLDTWKSVWKN
jgi:hypothetical protein